MQFVLSNWSQILGLGLGVIVLALITPWLLMFWPGWNVLWPGRG